MVQPLKLHTKVSKPKEKWHAGVGKRWGKKDIKSKMGGEREKKKRLAKQTKKKLSKCENHDKKKKTDAILFGSNVCPGEFGSSSVSSCGRAGRWNS